MWEHSTQGNAPDTVDDTAVNPLLSLTFVVADVP